MPALEAKQPAFTHVAERGIATRVGALGYHGDLPTKQHKRLVVSRAATVQRVGTTAAVFDPRKAESSQHPSEEPASFYPGMNPAVRLSLPEYKKEIHVLGFFT